jgi:hypothetical protein
MAEADLKRVDFEPYFLMWDSVLHFPNPALPKDGHIRIHGYRGNLGSIPCHRHRACGGLVHASQKIPPKVCPECGSDTSTEIPSTTEMPKEVVLPPGVERE